MKLKAPQCLQSSGVYEEANIVSSCFSTLDVSEKADQS